MQVDNQKIDPELVPTHTHTHKLDVVVDQQPEARWSPDSTGLNETHDLNHMSRSVHFLEEIVLSIRKCHKGNHLRNVDENV